MTDNPKKETPLLTKELKEQKQAQLLSKKKIDAI
jgi:hypothetical protein